jgi:hypothetical protein
MGFRNLARFNSAGVHSISIKWVSMWTAYTM